MVKPVDVQLLGGGLLEVFVVYPLRTMQLCQLQPSLRPESLLQHLNLRRTERWAQQVPSLLEAAEEIRNEVHPLGQDGPIRDPSPPQAVRSGVYEFEQGQELAVDQERQRWGEIAVQ